MNWQNESVMVTGGGGFIGSHLVDALVTKGATVTVVDNFTRGHYENLHGAIQTGRVKIRRLHIDEGGIPNDYSIIFHLAARVTNIQANRHDHLGMLQDNLAVNWAVVDSIRRVKPKLAVLVSTVCVYPHDTPIPTPEAAAYPFHPEPTNEGYGLAKAILEKQAEYLHREHGVPVIVPRFSNAIGERDYYDWESSHVVPALIRKVHEHDSIKVWGSGEQSRVFVDARDIARALGLLAENPNAADARPVNVGHEREVSIAKLLFTILEMSGKTDVPVQFDRMRPDGHKRRLVDVSRLRELTGWVPSTPLRDTLGRMIAEYQEGRAWL